MSFRIQAEPLPQGDALRRLVTSALPELLGGGRVVSPDLKLPGRPMLAMDGNGFPVLVCFDGENGVAVMADAAGSVAALTAHNAFWVPLCPDLAELEGSLDRLRLLLLVPEGTPGGLTLCGTPMECFTMRAVRVDGQAALFTVPLEAPPAGMTATSAGRPDRGRVNRFRSGEIALTGEEAAFFDRL